MSTTTTTLPAAATGALDDRELRAWRGLLRVHATLSKALDNQLDAEHDLPLTSYEVLKYLADAEEQKMRMCDLASSVILSRSGLTRLVDRLERQGLVRRERCGTDGRGTYAVITPEGAERFAQARPTHIAGVRRLFLGPLKKKDQRALADAFDLVLGGDAA